jgi:hypothetical protein
VKAAVVTEGHFDANVIRKVLDSVEPSVQAVEIVAVAGWSAAESLARSILVSRSNPVALVIDSDEADIERAEDRRRFLETSLATAGGSSTRAKVILFIPTIEAVFFRRPKALSGVVLTRRQRERAKYEPRQVLRQIMDADGSDRDFVAVEGHLAPQWDEIAEEREFRELIAFLRKVAGSDLTSS